VKKAFVFLLALLLAAASAVADETIAFDKPETAGISGTRWFWDLPVVLAEDGQTVDYNHGGRMKAKQAVWCNLGYHGGYGRYQVPKQMQDADGKKVPWELRSVVGPICFDAVHRSVLVRFPGAAEGIAKRLNEGMEIRKVELVLPFRDTEKVSRPYKGPTSFLMNGGQWDKITPRWHAVAWALRKPWAADQEMGPTYNAYVNGAGYWKKYGAQDTEHDRFPAQFGPAEVSAEKVEALDVTAVLTDEAFGKTLGERLRVLSDQGFLVRKWQVYDFRFTNPGYEWGTMTGGRGVFLNTPKLTVTLGPAPDGDKRQKVVVPPATDVAKLAQELKQGKTGGAATARVPSPQQYEELKKDFAFAKPGWMPDWQWTRVKQLYDAGGHANAFPETYEEYKAWLDDILSTQPRKWEGFSAADQLTLFYKYEKALPTPVVDHWRAYWTAWLMPHRHWRDMVHNQYHQIWTKWRGAGSDYFDKTGDWRGNSSFYRASYCRIISTMNFNHTAALGALLGGHFIGSEYAVEDGRFALEHFPLRLWAWYDGTSQESIDHYYLSHTLTAQKMFADFAPTHYDRMMGQSILLKNIDELANCYHPNLRRFVSTAGRTTPFYAMQVQEGVQHIVHSLSPEGALTDLDKVQERRQQMRNKQVNKLPIIGHDLRPRRVAIQALDSPWAPEWMSNVVDKKPLPFEMTTTWKQWGAFRTDPKWKKVYMGQHYGVASFDLNSSPTINLMGLWQRKGGKLQTADDLGLLLVRYGYNRTNFIDTHMGGTLGQMGGGLGVLQHKGKLLIASSPHKDLKSRHYNPKKQPIASLQTSICLFSLQDKPTWKVYADGKPVENLPARLSHTARITVHDGVSYVGIIPLEATDLGRDAEIIIKEGGEPVRTQTGAMAREALLIESYNYKSDQPFKLERENWDDVDLACGGFVVELADATEFETFDAFAEHVRKAKLTQRWETAAETLHLAYASGGDLMEMGFKPREADVGDHRQPSLTFPYRRVNGEWPYLPPGVERDTPLSRQGRCGRIEKGGAVLTVEPGRMGYLLAEPTSGTCLAANPLPDPTHLSLSAPGGVRIEADGRLSIARIAVRPKEAKLWVDYAAAPGQETEDMAGALYVFGLAAAPTVWRNGKPCQEIFRAVEVEGEKAFIVPLGVAAEGRGEALERLQKSRKALAEGSSGPSIADIAVMGYENGQEHYLLTEPRSGYYAFQRLWPSPTVVRARVGKGLQVATDGRLALRRLILSPENGEVIVDAPAYMQQNRGEPLAEAARALVIWAEKAPPKVEVNGQDVSKSAQKVTLEGRPAHVVPLFGAGAGALEGLEERLRAAHEHLAKP